MMLLLSLSTSQLYHTIYHVITGLVQSPSPGQSAFMTRTFNLTVHLSFSMQTPACNPPPPHHCFSSLRLHSSHLRLWGGPAIMPFTAGVLFHWDGPNSQKPISKFCSSVNHVHSFQWSLLLSNGLKHLSLTNRQKNKSGRRQILFHCILYRIGKPLES